MFYDHTIIKGSGHHSDNNDRETFSSIKKQKKNRILSPTSKMSGEIVIVGRVVSRWEITRARPFRRNTFVGVSNTVWLRWRSSRRFGYYRSGGGIAFGDLGETFPPGRFSGPFNPRSTRDVFFFFSPRPTPRKTSVCDTGFSCTYRLFVRTVEGLTPVFFAVHRYRNVARANYIVRLAHDSCGFFACRFRNVTLRARFDSTRGRDLCAVRVTR